MWGVATGTAMALHRFRMQSPTRTAIHVGFGSLMIVHLGSYYFCVKRRDYREKMISMMMQLNAFEPADNIPETVPLDANHPFVSPVNNNNNNQDNAAIPIPAERQYVAQLPERKEWQKPLPTQDVADVFQEVPPSSKA